MKNKNDENIKSKRVIKQPKEKLDYDALAEQQSKLLHKFLRQLRKGKTGEEYLVSPLQGAEYLLPNDKINRVTLRHFFVSPTLILADFDISKGGKIDGLASITVAFQRAIDDQPMKIRDYRWLHASREVWKRNQPMYNPFFWSTSPLLRSFKRRKSQKK